MSEDLHRRAEQLKIDSMGERFPLPTSSGSRHTWKPAPPVRNEPGPSKWPSRPCAL